MLVTEQRDPSASSTLLCFNLEEVIFFVGWDLGLFVSATDICSDWGQRSRQWYCCYLRAQKPIQYRIPNANDNGANDSNGESENEGTAKANATVANSDDATDS